MATLDLRLGEALELPEGVFEVRAATRYGGIAVSWGLYDLQDEQGQQLLLVTSGSRWYRGQIVADTGGAEPREPRYRGEARVEHETADGSEFWRTDFRFYPAPGKLVVLTEDPDGARRLEAEELAPGMVRRLG